MSLSPFRHKANESSRPASLSVVTTNRRSHSMLDDQAERQQDIGAVKGSNVTEVYCDFDGTITRVDATDTVLEAFALPAWREWEQRWARGEITGQHCLSRQVELIQADRDTLLHLVADLPIGER